MKKTLVLGASLNTARYSNLVIHRLRARGVPVCAVGLRDGVVADVTIDTYKKQFNNIHTVTLYLIPNRQPEYYDYIIGLNPERVIFNPGTENPEFENMLSDNNIHPEVACTLVLLSTNQY